MQKLIEPHSRVHSQNDRRIAHRQYINHRLYIHERFPGCASNAPSPHPSLKCPIGMIFAYSYTTLTQTHPQSKEQVEIQTRRNSELHSLHITTHKSPTLRMYICSYGTLVI